MWAVSHRAAFIYQLIPFIRERWLLLLARSHWLLCELLLKIESAPLRDLTFFSDGEVMNLGLMETASQQINMDLRLETLQLSVPYDSFLKIANAKSVEAKLGSAKFALTENNLTFMRQFANRFKP